MQGFRLDADRPRMRVLTCCGMQLNQVPFHFTVHDISVGDAHTLHDIVSSRAQFVHILSLLAWFALSTSIDRKTGLAMASTINMQDILLVLDFFWSGPLTDNHGLSTDRWRDLQSCNHVPHQTSLQFATLWKGFRLHRVCKHFSGLMPHQSMRFGSLYAPMIP